jgi:hypothetical protein
MPRDLSLGRTLFHNDALRCPETHSFTVRQPARAALLHPGIPLGSLGRPTEICLPPINDFYQH